MRIAIAGATGRIGQLTITALEDSGHQEQAEIVDFFGTITRNLLTAEERAGVRHHVLLSIVGLEKSESARLTATTFADWLAAGAR